MYEEEIAKLELRRKELMDELDPLYVRHAELKAAKAPIAELNKVAREINPRANEVNAIDAKIAELSKANVNVPVVEEEPQEQKENPELTKIDSCTIVKKEPTTKKYLTKGGILGLVVTTLATGVGGTLLVQKLFKNGNCAGRCAASDYDQTVETDTVKNKATPTATAEPTAEPTIATPAATITPATTSAVTATPTMEPTATPVIIATPTVEPTATPVVTAEPTPTVEPGLDPTDEYSVENTVDKIYEEDINPMIQGLNNPAFEAQVTREDISDIVRFVNGELPLNRKYNEGTFDELASKFIYVFGAQGGHENELYPVHFSNLCNENSALASYCAEYDEIYNKIAAYRAEGNVDGFVEEVGYLSTKLYNEWHLQGMYGGWNPYLFTREEKFLAFNASIGRYANYVKEYLISNDLTVCFDACVDVENNTYKQIETRDVYEAMLYGTSLNGEVSIMIGDQVFNPNKMVSKDLKDVLNEKSQQAVKKLN